MAKFAETEETPEDRSERLRAVDAMLAQAGRDATRLLRGAGFRNRARETGAKLIATASRPCNATQGVKVTFNGARADGPRAVARVTPPAKRASGNGRIARVARGPILPTDRAAPLAWERKVCYTVARNGAVINGYIARTDSTHGDITGKAGYAAQ